jgi:hypothetical protein
MDPLDKLEIILRGEIAKKQKEFDRARGSEIKPSSIFMHGIEHEKIGLERALWQLRAIKQNAPDVSDEVEQKLYG